MRVSLQVDDNDTPGTPPPGASTPSAAGQATDVDAGAASREQATAGGAGIEAAGGNPDTPVSSPGAADTGGARESEAPPSGGEGTKAAKAAGEMESVKGYKQPDSDTGIELLAEVDENLKDIGEASFGPPQEGLTMEVVLGTDDRVKITNTNVYPWRVHCSLRIIANDGSQWIGTGWFIGPHTVITAGHCVYIKNSGVPGRDGWVRSITVIPGRNGTAQPYGSVVSSNLRTVTGWSNDGNNEYDYGAIILPTDLGNQTGWLGIGAYSDSTLLASTANISGYPGDKPAGTQWYHARRVGSVGARKVYYDVDTAGGQSGSAVYRIVNGQRHGIAVHAYGGATSNSGTRITSAVYNNLVAWKA